jgi:hypothetical protein
MLAYESRHYGEEGLAQAALEALKATTGLIGRIIQLQPDARTDRYRPDVAVALALGRTNIIYYGECKTHIDRPAILNAIKTAFDGLNTPGLLITSYLSSTLIDACRAIGLQCIDTAGNAYLDASGLYVLIKGQKPSNAFMTIPREHVLDNASALRMIFALLVKPELVRAPYREIVAAAGIALGSVGTVFRDLQQQGMVTSPDATYGRRLLEPNRLLDLWAITYPFRLRPKLHARRFRAPNPSWWHDLDPIELDGWWGSEIAADLVTGMLKPATQLLYVAPGSVQQTIRTLVAKHRLQPDPAGGFEILDAFWNLPRDPVQPKATPPILIYADLMASLDPRNREVAKTIRDLALADV